MHVTFFYILLANLEQYLEKILFTWDKKKGKYEKWVFFLFETPLYSYNYFYTELVRHRSFYLVAVHISHNAVMGEGGSAILSRIKHILYRANHSIKTESVIKLYSDFEKKLN